VCCYLIVIPLGGEDFSTVTLIPVLSCDSRRPLLDVDRATLSRNEEGVSAGLVKRGEYSGPDKLLSFLDHLLYTQGCYFMPIGAYEPILCNIHVFSYN
jgi:hypothetical protein